MLSTQNVMEVFRLYVKYFGSIEVRPEKNEIAVFKDGKEAITIVVHDNKLFSLILNLLGEINVKGSQKA